MRCVSMVLVSSGEVDPAESQSRCLAAKQVQTELIVVRLASA
jgi:hypothetical protein